MRKLICILAECGVHLLAVMAAGLFVLAAFLLRNTPPPLALPFGVIAAVCIALGIWFAIAYLYYLLST